MTPSPARTIDALNRENRRLRSIIDGVLLDCRQCAAGNNLTGMDLARTLEKNVLEALKGMDGNRR